MKKLEKFANNKIMNLNLCVGGTVYQTCGEGSENCADEAGSFNNGEFDDINEDGSDCPLVAVPIGPVIVRGPISAPTNYSL